MSRNARVLILVLGLIATAGGLGLTVANGGGIPLIVIGLLMLLLGAFALMRASPSENASVRSRSSRRRRA